MLSRQPSAQLQQISEQSKNQTEQWVTEWVSEWEWMSDQL